MVLKPSFTVTDATGKKVSLKDFKEDNMYSSISGPAGADPAGKENPNIVKAYAKYHDKGFEVVAISLDDKRAPWIKAIHTDKLPWIHLADLQAMEERPRGTVWHQIDPCRSLVDKEGKIIAKNLRGKDAGSKARRVDPAASRLQ